MVSFPDQVASGGPDVRDETIVACENIAVQQRVAFEAGQADAVHVEREKVRQSAFLYPAAVASGGRRSAFRNGFEERSPRRMT